jgi:hypothetical protein
MARDIFALQQMLRHLVSEASPVISPGNDSHKGLDIC